MSYICLGRCKNSPPSDILRSQLILWLPLVILPEVVSPLRYDSPIFICSSEKSDSDILKFSEMAEITPSDLKAVNQTFKNGESNMFFGTTSVNLIQYPSLVFVSLNVRYQTSKKSGSLFHRDLLNGFRIFIINIITKITVLASGNKRIVYRFSY
jgi:hypothetical protein